MLGVMADMHLTGRGKTLKAQYLKGNLDFEEIIPYLKYDYALAAARSYGRIPVDEVLIYDVQDPEQILMLSMIKGKRSLFITAENLEALRDGDRLMRDVLRYVAPRCGRIFVREESLLADAENALPGFEIHVMKGLEDFPWHCGTPAEIKEEIMSSEDNDSGQDYQED